MKYIIEVMKFIIILFTFLYHNKIYSDDYIFHVTGKDIINLELETTQGVKKILRHTDGNFTDNWGRLWNISLYRRYKYRK